MLDSLKTVIAKLTPSPNSSWPELVIIIAFFSHPTQLPNHPEKSKTARIQCNMAFKIKVVYVDQ